MLKYIDCMNKLKIILHKNNVYKTNTCVGSLTT